MSYFAIADERAVFPGHYPRSGNVRGLQHPPRRLFVLLLNTAQNTNAALSYSRREPTLRCVRPRIRHTSKETNPIHRTARPITGSRRIRPHSTRLRLANHVERRTRRERSGTFKMFSPKALWRVSSNCQVGSLLLHGP